MFLNIKRNGVNGLEKLQETLLDKLFSDKAENDDSTDADTCSMPEGTLPKTLAYAMAYVPFQQWETPYDSEVALSRGTVFPCLDKPFIGEEAVRRGDS